MRNHMEPEASASIGSYHPLNDHHEVNYDDCRLRQLGYKQELYRGLSFIANFSLTFSIVSVLTGISTLYNQALSFGGPVTIIYGWPIVGLMTLIVGLAMAEICSAYPTSAGLYYWSAKLAGNKFGPFAAWITGWFNIVGQWAVTASVDFSLAQLVQVIILLSTGGLNGGGYQASKYVVIALHGGILLLHAILNSLPILWLSFIGQLAAAWNVLGVFLLMILIPVVATERASAKFVFTNFNTENGDGINNNLYIFVLGLLMSQYTLTGYDASAHMTEETKNADMNGPKGIVSAIGISVIAGWAYILGITFAVTDIPHLLNKNNDSGGYAIAQIFYDVFKSRYGSGVGGIFCLGVIAVAVFFCGMSSLTSNSRMAYAFSRDGAMPYSSFWHKVNKQEVPLNAVWTSAFIAFCMALTSLGSLVAFQAMTSIATIGLYIAYALPILFRVTLARKSFTPDQTLNYTPVAVGGLFILVVSTWIFSARHWFKAGGSRPKNLTKSSVHTAQRVYVKGGGKKEEQPLELDVYNQGMFKTELCNKWQETGACPYRDNCQFAHGIEELRPVLLHLRYKTEVCRMVLNGDSCPYGHRCHFRHTLTDQEKLIRSLNTTRP
ncbi:hypothetical protein K7X08_030728 [Anisodus acutangulus]|uniref:C3H1-type domain-containing protein n=1 Tax=Anisodus acutangulus TaxID=402998 RepID=A0A9Q1M292_9SOLA|nr:hypothetical protein K7X08_030728 [Anisodus acutangulus]